MNRREDIAEQIFDEKRFCSWLHVVVVVVVVAPGALVTF